MIPVTTTTAQSNLQALLDSGQKGNIEIALEIAKGLNLTDFILSQYKSIFDVCKMVEAINSETLDEIALFEIVNLKYLYCSNTSIKELDVSKCVSLEYLDCDNNKSNFKLIK